MSFSRQRFRAMPSSAWLPVTPCSPPRPRLRRRKSLMCTARALRAKVEVMRGQYRLEALYMLKAVGVGGAMPFRRRSFAPRRLSPLLAAIAELWCGLLFLRHACCPNTFSSEFNSVRGRRADDMYRRRGRPERARCCRAREVGRQEAVSVGRRPSACLIIQIQAE